MKAQFSAGGIVIKKEQGQTLVLVSKHSGHHGWVFPKGHIGDTIEGESKEEAAVREVQEETGITGEIVQAFKPVEYWFAAEGEKIHKTVYYFLMNYVSGDIADHNWEMEDVEWLPEKDVAERLTYPSDKEAWREAQDMINSNTKARNPKQ